MAGGDPGGDFYLATKHKCVHYMKVKLNLPNHVIAAQMGWSESAVENLIAASPGSNSDGRGRHERVGALLALRWWRRPAVRRWQLSF